MVAGPSGLNQSELSIEPDTSELSQSNLSVGPGTTGLSQSTSALSIRKKRPEKPDLKPLKNPKQTKLESFFKKN